MKKLSILFITVSFLLSSCDSMLDINRNPNLLQDIDDVSAILPAAQVGIAYNMMGWNVGFGCGFWVEYWTQHYTASQFKSLCQYQSEDFNVFYRSFMVGPMKDLQYILDATKDDDSQLAYYYIAEALQIFGWQFLVDLYGNIPYTEALRGEEGINHPHFDTGEDIYDDLQKRIDALLNLDPVGSYIEKEYDFVFNGDMKNWVKFANSLKFKLMLRLSETANYNNVAVLNFIENNDLLTDISGKISGNIFANQTGKRHPFYEYAANGTSNYFGTNVIACKSFIDYLNVNGDPRLPIFFTNGTMGAFFGDYDSKQNSSGQGADNTRSYARVDFSSDAPMLKNTVDLVLLSNWETNFKIAEVYVRANQPGTAQQYYNAAIDAVFAQINSNLNTSSEDVDPIENTITEAGGYAEWPSSATTEEYLELIGQQRWVAHYYYQHGESFIERNRTKYPSVNDIDIKSNRTYAWDNFPVGQLTISVVGRDLLNGNLPSSLCYPESVVLSNNNFSEIGQKPNLGQKVFWDKKAGK